MRRTSGPSRFSADRAPPAEPAVFLMFSPASTDAFDPSRFVLDCRGRSLDLRPGLSTGAHVMGVLNVTPDSFSDGGRFLDPDRALRRVEEMVGEGARIVDVGGESSRPPGSVYGAGAQVVSADEERRRVLPVVEAVAGRFPDVLISVDTYKPEVAAAALEHGAHLLNDITGLRFGTEMADVAARYGAPLVVMHSLGRPGDVAPAQAYADVVEDVRSFLEDAVRRAGQRGVRQVVVDPGFGFGKTIEENLRLVGNVNRFLDLGRPVLIGVSRKSTIGAVLGRPGSPVPVEQRLYGALGATAVAVLRGASIVRTHDVRPTAELLRVLAATMG